MLAESGGLSLLGGIKGLNISISDLLSVVNAYIPIITAAGVHSETGFTVFAEKTKETDSHSGSAGGLIGWGSGVQVSRSAVDGLKHTKVVPPKELENNNAPSYFDASSVYAVTAPKYAGGCSDLWYRKCRLLLEADWNFWDRSLQLSRCVICIVGGCLGD